MNGLKGRMLVWAFLPAVFLASFTAASPPENWVRDDNRNKIDDAIEDVAAFGLERAYQNGDVTGRILFYVNTDAAEIQYGLYVRYDHPPAAEDVNALEALGVPYARPYRYIDYIRTEATYAQIQQIASLPGVARIEVVPAMYPTNDNGTRTLKARDSNFALFPTAWHERGITGKGVVIGVLDSGVNDQPLNGNTYPGHESLLGKFLGGGQFDSGNPLLNTQPNQSMNPANNPDAFLGTYHGTHVAGTAMGTGGPYGIRAGDEAGYYAGMAPDARLVDCKVISDGGVGFGAADALEWCIANKNNTWGLTGADTIYAGIDVLNLSIGGLLEESDGTQADDLAVNAAVRAGLVACVASGNDGNTQFISSPAAADFAITVGSLGDGNSLSRDDDIVASYSNEGPRDDDGDADHFDEMKPSVCGPGSGIISADGDIATDGTLYKQINGTSMACPHIAGLCALIVQANPLLSPLQVRDLLQDTAEHKQEGGKQPAGAVDPFGLDPNYHPSWGWGEPDAYAAVLEAIAPFQTQVIAMNATPVLQGGPAVNVSWTTQREIDLTGFEVLRTPDFQGTPGAFEAVSEGLIPGQGDPFIHLTSNRTNYTFHDDTAGLTFGAKYWYQIKWHDASGNTHHEPAFPVRIADVPVVARITFSVTHNSPDNDLTVWFGTGTDPNHPVFLRYPPGTPGEDSTSVDPLGDPLGVIGNTRHHFHVDLTALDGADTFLPPSAANPWFLAVKEAGFVDQSGRVNDFAVTLFTEQGPVTYASPQPPTETAETQRTTFWIPLDPVTTLNHWPVLSPVGDRMVDEGQPLAFTLSATDPDGDALTYAASGLPSGAAFDAQTRQFSWTPGFDQSGIHGVTFYVSDTAANADTESIAIDVADLEPGSNRTPVLTPTGDQFVRLLETLAFRIEARDPDGDVLTYAASPLPDGASIDAQTGDFEWTPGPGRQGRYMVNFTATDPAGRQAVDNVLISVLDADSRPPGGCEGDTTLFAGTTQAAANGIPAAYSDFTFTIGPDTRVLVGTLNWTGGPATDLDLFLLNASNEVVASSPTAFSPEVVIVGNPEPGTYTWRVQHFTTAPGLPFTLESAACIGAETVGVDETDANVPPLVVSQSFPNPFNPMTTLQYSVRTRSHVSIRIFSATGRLVRVLEDRVQEPGNYAATWNGHDENGRSVSSGIYFYAVRAGERIEQRKVVLLR